MKKLALILIALYILLLPVHASVSASPTDTAIQTVTAESSPTATPWKAYTEPPYTPVKPSANMIIIYFVIASAIVACGIGIYFILKKAEVNTDIK